MARTASSWASRRVELRASALTCLAKAWRSSSWGEECRRRWAYWTGLGVEGELGRGGQGAGSHGARIPPKVTHQALSLGTTPGNLTIHWSPQLHLARSLSMSLMHWPVSQQAESHLKYCPLNACGFSYIVFIPASCGALLHPRILKALHL